MSGDENYPEPPASHLSAPDTAGWAPLSRLPPPPQTGPQRGGRPPLPAPSACGLQAQAQGLGQPSSFPFWPPRSGSPGKAAGQDQATGEPGRSRFHLICKCWPLAALRRVRGEFTDGGWRAGQGRGREPGMEGAPSSWPSRARGRWPLVPQGQLFYFRPVAPQLGSSQRAVGTQTGRAGLPGSLGPSAAP